VRPVRLPPLRVRNCLEFNVDPVTSACGRTGDGKTE